MRASALLTVAGVPIALLAGQVHAQTTTVATPGSFSVSYGTVNQASPLIPWSDLGFKATASVTQGTLSGSVGGSTSFSLTNPGSSQAFTPGATQVSLGYTPNWTGSMSTAATGSLGLDIGYSIGPFHDSGPLFTDTMSGGVSGLDLASGLNHGSTVNAGATASGLGLGGGFKVSVQAVCPFPCVTVASASVSYHVGSKVTQSLVVDPNATYGDLIWYSSGANATGMVNVTGGSGSIANTFTAPSLSALGLPDTGGAFQMNILPYVGLALGVGNEATVSVPASIAYAFDVFGAKGSGIASGDLYALSTGLQDLTATGAWYSPDVYSIGLTATCTGPTPAGAESCIYDTLANVDPVTLFSYGGNPLGIPLSNGSPGTAIGGGPSSEFPNLGPLVPGDTPCVPGAVCNPPCPPDPTGAPQCITTVTLTSAPEPGSAPLVALALAGIAAVTWKRSRQSRASIRSRRLPGERRLT